MRTYPVDIFLPAAGFGERLRPATNHLPKPLLPILGTPIIEGILTRLAAVCDGRIGINVHWKADLLRAWAAASPWRDRIVFFPENPILGTGGALKNAASLLSDRPFIVHNSDILLDIDFSRLVEEHLASGNVATLVCHRLPHLSNVVVDEHGQVLDVENPGASRPDPIARGRQGRLHGDRRVLAGDPRVSSGGRLARHRRLGRRVQGRIQGSRAGRHGRVLERRGRSGDLCARRPGCAEGARRDGLPLAGRSLRAGRDRRLRRPGVAQRGPGRIAAPELHRPAGRGRVGPSREPDHRARLHDLPLRIRHAAVGPRRREEAGAAERPALRAALRDSAGHGPRGGASEGSPVWSDAILIGLGGSDRRYFRVQHDGRRRC